MQISVTFRQMDASDALRGYAQERIERVKRYIPSPVEANVVLSMERYLQVADITISANGLLVRGEEKSEDMYNSVDRAMEKIERQMKKLRQKVRRKVPIGGERELAAEAERSLEEGVTVEGELDPELLLGLEDFDEEEAEPPKA
jgi:putative sigma-54 modulation protein